MAHWTFNSRFGSTGSSMAKNDEETFAERNHSHNLDLRIHNFCRPVILDFGETWCEACHELDAKTFSHPTVQKASDGILWVKYDATEITPEFEELQKKFGILGLPTTVFLDARGEWVKDITLTGFEPPEQFLKRLDKFKNRYWLIC